MVQTGADFDGHAWHDCHIWSLELRAGSPEEGDWRSELALGLDLIVEWICGVDGGGRFRVAPAELVFHEVTDPKLAIDWAETGRAPGVRAAVHPVSIEVVERDPAAGVVAMDGGPYFLWRIRCNWPRGGEIAFGASGFTQSLLAEPLLTERQHLTPSERARALRER